MATERRVLAGFGGYLWGELLPWLGWRGLVKVAAATGVVNVLLVLGIKTEWGPGWVTFDSLDEAVDWIWLIAVAGAILVTVGPVVAERRRGTAGWVVSKPVSRGTYIVGKVVAHSLGVAVSLVLVPGLVAYLWVPGAESARGFSVEAPPFGRYLVSLGIIMLLCSMFVALVVMMGTLTRRRSLVTGLALIMLIPTFAPPAALGWSDFLPGMLIDWARPTELSALADYLFGATLPGAAVATTIAATAVFTLVATASFRRAEL